MVAPAKSMPSANTFNLPSQTAAEASAMCGPAGSASRKQTPVSAVASFGLVMVKVKLVVALSAMLDRLKAALIFGGIGRVRLNARPEVSETAAMVTRNATRIHKVRSEGERMAISPKILALRCGNRKAGREPGFFAFDYSRRDRSQGH